MLQALSIYGIDKVYIDKAQAESRGITDNSTSFNVQFIAQTEIEALYRNADTVLRF
jgi:sulfur relay (sulfurtransferase) DsrF/TusC family protein